MKSMTGYALYEESGKNAYISLEIKSYNSRYLDLNINLPFWLSGLEPVFKDFFASKIARGKVDITVRVKDFEFDAEVCANTSIAKTYAKALKEIADAVEAPYVIDINTFCEKEGVLTVERNVDLHAWEAVLMPIAERTFLQYDKTKSEEGAALYADIVSNLDTITAAVKTIKEYVPQLEQIFYQNIKNRLNELTEIEINEQRIMQEIAIMLVKYTINEEIVRLEAHCKTLYNEIKQFGPVGKRLDFLCQEINREINTIGSKNQMIEIVQPIIDVKEALENIREQGRNAE